MKPDVGKTMTGRRDEDNEIEITPKMIEAGMYEYGIRWRGLRDADDDVAKEMLEAAFASRLKAR